MIFFSLIDAPFKKIKSSFYNKQNKNLCYISKEKKLKAKNGKHSIAIITTFKDKETKVQDRKIVKNPVLISYPLKQIKKVQ